VVGRLGVGLDNIDLDACRARGIAVCPATGANESAVAEYVIAATLALLRGAFSASPAMIAGGWPREALIGREVAGRTMGLVGFGAIARQVSSRCSALGMNVAAYDPYLPASDPAWQQARRHERLPELLGVADVVSVHVLLNETTRRLIDASALAAMRAGAVLINTSRGGIVDERALAAALRAGKLGGAALDVFEREPLAGEDAAVFAGCPNLILTPHIAGVTVESNIRVSMVTARSVRAALAKRAQRPGRPRQAVAYQTSRGTTHRGRAPNRWHRSASRPSRSAGEASGGKSSWWMPPVTKQQSMPAPLAPRTSCSTESPTATISAGSSPSSASRQAP
jgi:(S)-sulfolactate dehydrogenase